MSLKTDKTVKAFLPLRCIQRDDKACRQRDRRSDHRRRVVQSAESLPSKCDLSSGTLNGVINVPAAATSRASQLLISDCPLYAAVMVVEGITLPSFL